MFSFRWNVRYNHGIGPYKWYFQTSYDNIKINSATKLLFISYYTCDWETNDKDPPEHTNNISQWSNDKYKVLSWAINNN